MRGVTTPILIFIAVVAVAILFALVTSISSLAMPPGAEPLALGNAQVLTPTPALDADSVAGSTDGIWWMAVAIVAIIVIPLLANPAVWKKGS